MSEVVWRWNPKQSEALLSQAPFLDIEGGIRAGKTTPLMAKVGTLVIEWLGIHCFLGRWTEDAMDGQLRPAWVDYARKCGIHMEWNNDESYYEILGTRGGPENSNSRVYMKGLRTSEESAKYQKLRGLNLSFIGLDQAEEVPYDYFQELVGRMSQVGYPKQFWVVPQPVPRHHWIDREFPVDNRKSTHHYIRTNCYDNRHVLGDDYIKLLEDTYPEGSAERRTLLEGRRGLTMQGDAVYKGYFKRDRHERMVDMNPNLPLYQSIDFGHHHPCISWHQFHPVGRWVVLGAVMGKDMFLEDFIPAALQVRREWFGEPMTVQTTGDPAGLAASSQGVSVRVTDILSEFGIDLSATTGANSPELRYQAIQTSAQYMRRIALDGEPAFIVCPRQVELSAAGADPSGFLIDGFEAGYIWDTRLVQGKGRTLRTPKKDGYYDHFQNTHEYIALAFSPAQPTQDDVARAERAALKRSQRDDDPDDAPGRRRRTGSSYLRGRR